MKIIVSLSAVLACAGLVSLTACSKKPRPETTSGDAVSASQGKASKTAAGAPAGEGAAAGAAGANGASPQKAEKPDVKLPPGMTPAVGAVATVNGKDIPAAAFNRDLARLVGTGVRVPKDRLKHIARNILARLIERELRNQAITTEQIVLTEPEFEEAYKAYTSRYVDAEGHFDEVQFRTALKRNHMTLSALKAQIRRERMARKLVEKLGNVVVTEDEKRAFYDNNNSSWVEAESRDVRVILTRCPPRPNKEQADACKKRATEVYGALSAGGDFEQIAERFGNTPPMAPIHLTRSSHHTALARAAFGLKVGEVHKPIKTPQGWYVIRLIEKNKARTKTYDEVEGEIGKRLKERKVYLEGLRIVQELKKKATIVTRLPY